MIEVNHKLCKCGRGELCQNMSWVCSIYITNVYMIHIVFFLQHVLFNLNFFKKITSFQHWFMLNLRIYNNLLFGKDYAATGLWYEQLSRCKIFFNIVTGWKVPIVGVFLVLIFPHSDWIRRRIGTEYGEILRMSPYVVLMRENRDRKTPTRDFFYAVCLNG